MLSFTFASKETISTISSKGQVTLPVMVRRHLGVRANDRVAFVVTPTGEVRVAQVKYPTIASLSGVAGSLKESISWKDIQKIAHKDRLAEKYGK